MTFLPVVLTPPNQSVLTQHNDNARTGAYLGETELTPATVSTGHLSELYRLHVDGQIAAQPLYVHGLNVNGVTRNVLLLQPVRTVCMLSIRMMQMQVIILFGKEPSGITN